MQRDRQKRIRDKKTKNERGKKEGKETDYTENEKRGA